MVRPGRDVLHLVTVVPTNVGVRDGEAVLQHYRAALLGTMAALHHQVREHHPQDRPVCAQLNHPCVP